MDNNSDWAASALFSPSKARVQQARAQDWASIDSWLSKKYGSKPLPSFERNEDTLQTLLTLATMNENMDEERSYIDRLEKAALQAIPKRTSSTTTTVIPLVLDNMKVLTSLDCLAQISIELGIGDVKTSSMASCVVDLTTTQFDTSQQLQHATEQLRSLATHRQRLIETSTNLDKDDFQPPADLPGMTSEWQRNTKHLKAKVAEYDDRLTSVRAAQTAGVRLEDVTRQDQITATSRARLANILGEIEAFEGLSTDSNAARRQVERARDDLRRLVNQRDRMFEDLAEAK